MNVKNLFVETSKNSYIEFLWIMAKTSGSILSETSVPIFMKRAKTILFKKNFKLRLF